MTPWHDHASPSHGCAGPAGTHDCTLRPVTLTELPLSGQVTRRPGDRGGPSAASLSLTVLPVRPPAVVIAGTRAAGGPGGSRRLCGRLGGYGGRPAPATRTLHWQLSRRGSVSAVTVTPVPVTRAARPRRRRPWSRCQWHWQPGSPRLTESETRTRRSRVTGKLPPVRRNPACRPSVGLCDSKSHFNR